MEKFISAEGSPVYIDPAAVSHVSVTKTDIEIHFLGGTSVVVADSVANVLGAINNAKSIVA
jgi:hypothetical protein|tara:strand:+ start:2489 stop:2671 length:183 start_codon:yes stop_codon:yes gene_type:complete